MAKKPEIPVYIFMGLLESGKTSVIQDFLDNNQFAKNECNLIIMCEEGEEELDSDILQGSHSKLVLVEDESELTPEFFQQLNDKYKPSSVLIELNGMWNATEFMNTEMPDGWFVFQTIGLVNAETFEVYQKNMKDIFAILSEYGNPKLAIRYARRIIKDGKGKTPSEIAPGTKVYELVEELAKYLPEEIGKSFR